MKLLIEFLKRFAPMLRSGKMSYSDALTRFRAQFGRPAEGMEKAAIMKEVEKAPSNIIEFPKDRITDWWKSRPGEASPLFKDSPEAIAKIKAENKAAAERLRKKKDRVATADELEDYINELDPTGETGVVQ